MTIIHLLVLSSFGYSSCIAGPIIPGNSQLYQDVKQSDGTTVLCKKFTEENRCVPGHEILEECDYEYGPMKCVPCRHGYYQCDFLTSDAAIKCYQPECPELGKETIVKVTNNSDGTCSLECVCNEAKGYSGSDYTDCTLQTTVCGVDSELKNGVCVGCGEGYHNPDGEFGVCVPKPSAPVTTLSSDLDANRNETNILMSTTNVKTPTDTPSSQVNKSKDQTMENTTPHNQQPSKDNKSSVSGVQHNVLVGIVVAVGLIVLVGVAVLVKRGGTIICCSYLQTKKVAQGTDGDRGQRNGISDVRMSDLLQPLQPTTVSAGNEQQNTDITCQPNQPAPSGPSGPPAPPAPPAASPQPTIPAPEQPSIGDLSIQMFNIILIFAKADEDLAFEIKKRLNEMVLIGGVRVKMWDFNHPSFGGSILNLPQQFTSQSCLILVVMTDHTVNDSLCQYVTEEAVAITRIFGKEKTKTCSVRLLHTQPPNERTYDVPNGHANIIPVDWFGPKYADKLRDLCIHLLDHSSNSE